jgi:hypothetical protein
VSASKDRPRWDELPGRVRRLAEALAGGRVIRAESCPGGFSPGFASRLTLAVGPVAKLELSRGGLSWLRRRLDPV